MSVRCQCPHCQTVVSIYEKAFGHRIRCPACQQLIEAVAVTPPAYRDLPESSAADADGFRQETVESLAGERRVESERWAGEPVLIELVPIAPPVIEPTAGGGSKQPQPSRRKPIIFREKRKAEEAEMDMTPMVDVVFQLLIFFMLTASFTMQKSLNVPKPQQDEASSQAQSVEDFQNNPEFVVVRIDAVNTYHVSTAAWPDEIEAPSEQELLVRLRLARQGDAQGNVPSKLLVIANGEALHERVVTAIDAGNDVGMEEVQLLTVEEDDS
jgi:biopolymer transport protein ExbD